MRMMLQEGLLSDLPPGPAVTKQPSMFSHDKQQRMARVQVLIVMLGTKEADRQAGSETDRQ